MADTNLDKSKIIIPGHGNVLVSVNDVADPFNPESFVIGDDATYDKKSWMSIGYTSKDDTIEFDKDGGDANAVDTWEEDAVDVTYDPILWSFVVRALSMQKLTYDLAFGGGSYDNTLKGYAMGDITAVTKSVMILFAHGGKRGGIYIRSAKLSVGDAPSIDPEKFFEVEINGSVTAPDVKTWGKVFWFDVRNYKQLAAA